ncbi:Trifunctional nucleotide phosphoesterase protein YfkN precursor [Mycobacteroides abscessus subsp. abscessus]|nr:Trifunctional nucleotide phosphoesterase protein YfkN precursor [Mycobacteroides abscessus subsp. abscessus]
MKKSFVSGLAAFALLFAPLSSSTLATGLEEELVSEDAYFEDVAWDAYGDVAWDAYGDVAWDAYGDVAWDAYGDVAWDAYGDVAWDAYGDVAWDAYGDVAWDAYGDVIGDAYGDVVEDAYGDVIGDAYGDVVEDAYGDVIGDAYGDVVEDAYGDVIGDVYGDVIEDAYVDAPYLPEEISEDVVYDYSNLQGGNLELTINTAGLSEDSKNHSIIVNKGDVKVAFPLSLFTGDQSYTITIKAISVAGALGTVYDFTIQSEDGKVISVFKENPVTLTFTVDPTKVTNWDNVKVVYINNEGVKTSEQITPLSVDEKSGVVVAQVTHFSAYGVFEVASASTGTDAGTNTGSTGTDTTSGTTSGTNTGSTTTNTTTTTSKSTVTTASTTSSGNALPNTATNAYNMLLAGLLVVALGGILLIVKLRKEMQVN